LEDARYKQADHFLALAKAVKRDEEKKESKEEKKVAAVAVEEKKEIKFDFEGQGGREMLTRVSTFSQLHPLLSSPHPRLHPLMCVTMLSRLCPQERATALFSTMPSVVHRIKLSGKSFSFEAAQAAAAKLSTVQGLRVADLSDTIAGRSSVRA
jgi:hypothetical protein